MIKLNIPNEKPDVYTRVKKQSEFDENIQNALTTIRNFYENKNFDLIEKERYYRKYKNLLWEAQHKKCAFCEEEVKRPQCDVEHFRPFKYSINEAGARKDGIYSWLGYEWLNFVVSCKTCNVYKKNHFPLVNEVERVELFGAELNNEGNLGNEEPILINPRYESPNEYISYDIDEIRETGQVFIRPTNCDPNNRGSETIKLLDLNRDKTNKKQNDENYDALTSKRGDRLLLLIDLVDNYKVKKANHEDLAGNPEVAEDNVEKAEVKQRRTKEQILNFISPNTNTEFLGLLLWYLRTQSGVWNDFTELHCY